MPDTTFLDNNIFSEPRWQSPSISRTKIPHYLREWLCDESSLTQKLVERSLGKFSLQVLSQSVKKPYLSEAKVLNISVSRSAVVREVVLYGDDIPWVYARTVIPFSSLSGSLKRLRYLGNRSLGSTLFADPNMQRGPLQIAPIASAYLPSSLTALAASIEPTWGRRSLFITANKPLLVTEVFLEGLWDNV